MSDATNRLTFVDVSGVGNSGKSAVVDLLREFEGVYCPEYWFEFDFIRVPGGLLDLRHHLVEDWSPIRSHAAFHEFISVARKMGCNPAWWDLPGHMRATSQRYDRRFGGRFVALSEAFAKSFVRGAYRAEWPFDGLRDRGSVRLLKKILRRLGGRRNLTRDVLLLDGTDFDRKASEYLESLYRSFIPPEVERVVLNNGFEPFNPRPCLDMLCGSKQIVVTRDPRDVYVSGLNFHNVASQDSALLPSDNDGLNKSFLATDDLELFVARYRLYHQKLPVAGDDRVLRLGFEELVLDYERSVARICTLLGLDERAHERKGTCFVPASSGRNIGLWRRYSKSDEIRYIEKSLADYLVAV